jgi:sec-independent protein translocase protein TatA
MYLPPAGGVTVFKEHTMSLTHWLVVIVVALLLFGRGKISEMMGDLAKGIKSFKKGMAEDDEAPIPQKTIDYEAPKRVAKKPAAKKKAKS